MIVTFDIETIPVQDAGIIADIASEIKAPGTYKKAESIAEWEATQKQTAIDEAVAKTSFDGAYGQICCIGWAVDDMSIKSAVGKEEDIINAFFNHLTECNPRGTDSVFVGHNVSAFDLRFLFQRAIILGIQPPAFIPFNAKSWSDTIFDTMTYFAGYGNRISLDKLSKALGFEGKTGITGADVWPMYQAGKIKEIAKYCEHDVELTRNVYKRLTFKTNLGLKKVA
jgi:predicted PolB exonuclease-like 3'-5' exonuclease